MYANPLQRPPHCEFAGCTIVHLLREALVRVSCESNVCFPRKQGRNRNYQAPTRARTRFTPEKEELFFKIIINLIIQVIFEHVEVFFPHYSHYLEFLAVAFRRVL